MVDSVITWNLEPVLAQRGLSTADLARRGDLEDGPSRAALYRLSAAQPERINLKTLDWLCQALDVPPTDLLTWSPDRGDTPEVESPDPPAGTVIAHALAAARAARAEAEADEKARRQMINRAIDWFEEQCGEVLTPALAHALGAHPTDEPFASMRWYLTRRGEKALEITLEGSSFRVAPQMGPDRPELAANLHGYAVSNDQAFSLLAARDRGSSDVHVVFSLLDGPGGSAGFHDPLSLGRHLINDPHRYLWDDVVLHRAD